MKNPNLAHVQAGDRILEGGMETEIATVLTDGVRLADGRWLTEHDFFHRDILVIPNEAPEALTLLIEAQGVERAKAFVAIRRLSGLEEAQFTIVERASGRLLRSIIRTEEDAEVSFCAGEWEEGKPGIVDCSTEYVVGDEEFRVPDGFEPRRYL